MGIIGGMVGEMAGNYQLTEQLGAGGMADVDKGVHATIGSRVAVKVMATTAGALDALTVGAVVVAGNGTCTTPRDPCDGSVASFAVQAVRPRRLRRQPRRHPLHGPATALIQALR